MHFLRRKPYADLPAYCRQFDVGRISFQVNDLTKGRKRDQAAGIPGVTFASGKYTAAAGEAV